ncbi:MAG: hypothetical protein Q8934_01835 [Bacillota bacterium]|nr:hypothetical protein [Bacillota bacterium]
MEKDQAVFLSKCIEKSPSSVFQVKKLLTKNNLLPNFHQWTNGKKVISGFEVTRLDTHTGYFFIFIDWHRNENYYLVIYTYNKSTTVAELRQTELIKGDPHLIWKYNPLKRDGLNQERKAYFKQTFGSTIVQIPLPKSSSDIDTFFNQLFTLCQRRLKADKIVEIFNFHKEI